MKSSARNALIVVGTRPEAIKLAPLAHAFDQSGSWRRIICHSGQHRDMVEPMLRHFRVRPDVELDTMSPGQSLVVLASKILSGLDGVIDRYSPDFVVGQGDTVTAMMASLAAFYRGIPFVHVEAGLRTGDLMSPWPEEMHRRVASIVSTLHCAPTPRAREALVGEGVPAAQVRVVGNTVVDALLWTLNDLKEVALPDPKFAPFTDREIVTITCHRRESFGGALESVFEAVAELAQMYPKISFVFPVHLNPNVREPAWRILGERENVHLLEPAPYRSFIWLLARSKFVISDSGGLQEEMPTLRRPLLVTRSVTERPEAIECGAARLVGADRQSIVAESVRLLTDPSHYKSMQSPTNPFGDGCSALRIVEWMGESGKQ